MLQAKLVQDDLVPMETMDLVADEFLETMDNGTPPCLLGQLIRGTTPHVSEYELLRHIVEVYKYPLVDLNCYDVPEELRKRVGLAESRATWAVPFDHEDGIAHIASTYLLSTPVLDYWRKQVGGPILWFACTHDALEALLDSIEAEQAAAPVPS